MSQIKTKFILNNAVTNAKLAQMPTLTIKGNNTGGTANALDLTVAQVNLILPVFTSTLNGLVPLSGGGTTNFLRADGTFAVPPGTSTGTVTSVSVVTANGISGSVATSTTTPAITLTLGAITPSSVAATGTVTGSNLSGTNTGDVTLAAVGSSPNANGASLSGQVLNLQPFSSAQPGVVTASGGGTTNFLRADGTWAAPSGGGGTNINARYSGTSTTLTSSPTTIVWSTQAFDTNSAMSSGVYTIPTTGKYLITSSVLFNGTYVLNNAVNLYIYKNGSSVIQQTFYAFASENAVAGMLTDIVSCTSGDTITIRGDSNASSPSYGGGQSWVAIAYIGT